MDQLRRRLLTAEGQGGMRLATGKTQLEKSKGIRGGKMGRRVSRHPRLSVIVQNTREYSQVHNRGYWRVGNGAVLPVGASCSSAPKPGRLAEIALNWILRGKKQ